MQPNNDNNQRPAEFDAAVLSYMPALRTLAKKYIPADKREDVIQDVLAYIFKTWRGYHGDGYGQGSGFFSWLRWCFRSVTGNYKQRRTLPMAYGSKADEALRTATVMASQERALVASDLLARCEGREGIVLLRRGCGEGLKEIGADMGITRERVRQLEVAGRAKLAKVAA